MAIKTLINGELNDKISFQDRGLQYGDGVFETIAVNQNKVLCLQAHLERLKKGCERLSIPIPELDAIHDEIDSLASEQTQAVIKVIITRGQGGRGYAIPETVNSNRIISLYPGPDYPEENVVSGVKTRLCQTRYSHQPLLAGIKHLNRLEQIMARSEWQDESIKEGLVMDYHDNVIEGTMSNLFYVKHGKLFTPELSQCGVNGIIREQIINITKKHNIELQVVSSPPSTVTASDEVFICNSIIGVWPVNSIDEHVFSVGEMTKEIQRLLIENNCIAAT